MSVMASTKRATELKKAQNENETKNPVNFLHLINQLFDNIHYGK